LSYKQNNFKNATHGFFLALATTVAEPSTILPLIIHHFSENLIIVGLFSSLLRGGAIVVQLFAAFYAQGYKEVMPYMKIVFVFRFLSWFGIGLAIFLVGDSDKDLTLWLIGIGLFFFSFSAGFGGIYFKEIIAKVFSKQERGKSMSNKQFFASAGSLLSGGVAGLVLDSFPAPQSYAYLFMVSAFFMALGLFAFSTIDEPIKEKISQKEESFWKFIKNAYSIFMSDERLRVQVLITLFGYSFLFALPFVILNAKDSITLSGWLVGGFVAVQMIGSMAGNLFLWKRITHNYVSMMQLSFVLMIVVFLLAYFASSAFEYVLIFFIFGIARDGFRNADMNLILEIAPQEKRPVYVAIQSTLTSIGLFFAIIGGFVLESFGYDTLYIVTIFMLMIGLVFSQKLNLLNR
jgi:MFS family permease